MVKWLEITEPSEAIAHVIERLGPAAREATREAMRKMVMTHQGKMIRTRFRGYSGKSGDRLQRRSGVLARSFGVDAKPGSDEHSSYSAGAKHAAIQETGGIVKSKTGKMLTIPFGEALTKGGRMRSAAKLVNRGGSWQTQGKVPGADGTATFIRKSKKGTPIIFVQGKNGKPIALYALKQSVEIKPGLGFMLTWDGLNATREKQWSKALDSAISETAEKL